MKSNKIADSSYGNFIETLERAGGDGSIASPKLNEKEIRVKYFTDPFCTVSWAMEPHLKKWIMDFGQHLDIDYRMGGLMPMWELYRNNGISSFEEMAESWKNAGSKYELQLNGSVWLTDPPFSSFPPSIAFKAAQLQSQELAIRFFDRIRNMLFVENINISKWENLWKAAEEVGLDPLQLSVEHTGEARHLFEEDLHLVDKLDVMGFPTLLLTNEHRQTVRLEGFQTYRNLTEGLTMVLNG